MTRELINLLKESRWKRFKRYVKLYRKAFKEQLYVFIIDFAKKFALVTVLRDTDTTKYPGGWNTNSDIGKVISSGAKINTQLFKFGVDYSIVGTVEHKKERLEGKKYLSKLIDNYETEYIECNLSIKLHFKCERVKFESERLFGADGHEIPTHYFKATGSPISCKYDDITLIIMPERASGRVVTLKFDSEHNNKFNTYEDMYTQIELSIIKAKQEFEEWVNNNPDLYQKCFDVLTAYEIEVKG